MVYKILTRPLGSDISSPTITKHPKSAEDMWDTVSFYKSQNKIQKLKK